MTSRLPSEPLRTVRDFEAFIPGTALEPLGVQVLAVDEQHMLLRMPITDAARQPAGLLHGGISLLLAESAASMHACWGIDLRARFPVGIEINGSHLRSASVGHVRAEATLIRGSLNLAVHEVRITNEETGELLCLTRVTNFYKKLGS